MPARRVAQGAAGLRTRSPSEASQPQPARSRTCCRGSAIASGRRWCFARRPRLDAPRGGGIAEHAARNAEVDGGAGEGEMPRDVGRSGTWLTASMISSLPRWRPLSVRRPRVRRAGPGRNRAGGTASGPAPLIDHRARPAVGCGRRRRDRLVVGSAGPKRWRAALRPITGARPRNPADRFRLARRPDEQPPPGRNSGPGINNVERFITGRVQTRLKRDRRTTSSH